MYAIDYKNQYSFVMENAPNMNEAVANIVKTLRQETGYTQEQLAGFAKTSRSQIAQLEAGTRGVTLSSLYWIAESFGVDFLRLIAMIEAERIKLSNTARVSSRNNL